MQAKARHGEGTEGKVEGLRRKWFLSVMNG